METIDHWAKVRRRQIHLSGAQMMKRNKYIHSMRQSSEMDNAAIVIKGGRIKLIISLYRL